MADLFCERCDGEIKLGTEYYTGLDGYDVLCEVCKEEVLDAIEEDARRIHELSDAEVYGYHEG